MSSIDLGAERRTSDAAAPSWTHLHLDCRSAAHWRVTFDHPPINTITATTVTELSALVDLIERQPDLNVVVFDSANPDFFLAHYDTEHDPQRTAALPPGPTGMHAWLDLLVRLSRAPVVSIAAVRGRVRAAGSEFVLACDLRFASRENALLGQPEVGMGFVPGGGPMARLSRLVGRGRALEILLMADDLDGSRAELYGYVNRAIPNDELEAAIEAMATRLAGFDHEAIRRTKHHVDQVTLPPDSEFPPALQDFFQGFRQPGPLARTAKLEQLGLNTDGDLERRLGTRVVEAAP
jgi:enoyl-CoA hydratase/carnithine racemase